MYGFFVCLSYIPLDESEFNISLRCTFKVHHKFANPYSRSKREPLTFDASNRKRGVIIFIHEKELDLYIKELPYPKLSVLLELA